MPQLSQASSLGKLNDRRTFQHTSVAIYILAAAAVGCIFYDSTKVSCQPASGTL